VPSDFVPIVDVQFNESTWRHIDEERKRGLSQDQIRQACLGPILVRDAYANPRTGERRFRVIGKCYTDFDHAVLCVVIEVIATALPGIYLVVTAYPANRGEEKEYAKRFG
jgi:hypothetical protein